MCGVIGVSLINPSNDDIETIKKIFIQLAVRGRHATGVSWINEEGKVQTESASVSADIFLENYNLTDTIKDGRMLFIGHTRYSTSDLEYNQPIGDDELSIVHNGVVTQSAPENWRSMYGDMFNSEENKNDSYLIYRAILCEVEPLEFFENCTAAVISLDQKGNLIAQRNNHRPLWTAKIGSCGKIYTSSKEILIRNGLSPTKLEPYTKYQHNGTDFNVISIENPGYGVDKQIDTALPIKFNSEVLFNGL